MAFTHILEHLVADESRDEKGIIACTDGDRVWYGKKYQEMTPPERAYVFVHELGHGIYMHADRAQLLRLMRGIIYPSLFNYAGDAIINEGIDANSAMPSGMFTPPKDFPPVRMDYIHKVMAEAIEFTKDTPPSNYDGKAKHGMQVEILYDWLVWALDAVNRKRREDAENCPRAQQKKQDAKSGEKNQPKPSDKGDKSDKGEKSDEKDGDEPGDGDKGDQPGDEGEGDQPGEDGKGNQPGDEGEGDGTGNGEGDKCDPQGKPSDKPCTCGQCDGQGEGGQGGGQGGEGQGGQPGGTIMGQGAGGNLTLIEQMAQDTAWDLEEQLGRMKELLDKGYTPTELIEKINERVTDARIRIEQVVQGLKMNGRGQGSILLELVGDLPRPVVPWNHVLRRTVTRGMGTKLNDSYVRYGSPTMTALARGARAVPFSPGTTIFTERPRVLVVLDVSGSHIGMLPVCFSEIWSIAKMKGAAVDVLTFDDGVQQILTIESKQDFFAIIKRGITGGGGTHLGNVWAHIAKMRDPYRMAVVMTDGYLDAGAKPKIPVVWLVTPGGHQEFPYGEVIYLPDLMKKAA